MEAGKSGSSLGNQEKRGSQSSNEKEHEERWQRGDRSGPPRSCGHVTDSICYFLHSGDDRNVLSREMNCLDSGFLDDIPAAVKRRNWDLGGKDEGGMEVKKESREFRWKVVRDQLAWHRVEAELRAPAAGWITEKRLMREGQMMSSISCLSS